MKQTVFFILALVSLSSFAQTQKTFKINKKYLNIPIQSSVELFVYSGEDTISDIFFASTPYKYIEIFANNGTIQFKRRKYLKVKIYLGK